MSKVEVEAADFDRICRLCLGSKRSLVDIYPEKKKIGSSVPLDQKIVTCTSISMFRGDGLPEKVCLKCVQVINSSFTLRTLAEKTDAQLREIVAKMEQAEEPSVEVTSNRLEGYDTKIEPVDAACNEDVNGQAQIKDEIISNDGDHDDDDDGNGYTKISEENDGGTGSCNDEMEDNDVDMSYSEDEEDNEKKRRKSSTRFSSVAAQYALALLSKQAGLTVTKRGNDKPTSSSKSAKTDETSKDTGDEDVSELTARRNLITQKIKELGKKMDGNKYYCQECKIFIGTAYFYNHVKFVHIKVRDHLCEDCGYRAQTGHILRQHIDAIHTDHTYPCDYCERTFGSMKSARDHMRSVHLQAKERAHICQFCGKGFFTGYYLRNHIRTHTMETPYKCQYCDRRFSFKWPCTTHERLHTGVKPYKCSFCPEAFTQNCVRKNHEYRAHGNEEFNPKNRKPREGNLREKKKSKLKIVPTDILAVSMSSETS